MGEALLDPVAVETHLVQERRAGPAQVVHRERLQRQPLLLRSRHDGRGHAIEGGARHGRIGVITGRQQVARIAGAGLERNQDVERLLREVLVTVPLSKIILGIGGTSPRFSSQLKTILKDDWESGQQASTKTM